MAAALFLPRLAAVAATFAARGDSEPLPGATRAREGWVGRKLMVSSYRTVQTSVPWRDSDKEFFSRLTQSPIDGLQKFARSFAGAKQARLQGSGGGQRQRSDKTPSRGLHNQGDSADEAPSRRIYGGIFLDRDPLGHGPNAHPATVDMQWPCLDGTWVQPYLLAGPPQLGNPSRVIRDP